MVSTPTAPILLVEDEPSLQSLLRRFLNAKGASVVCSGTVAEATAACRAQQFSAAVVDVSLPDGSGLELVNSLHSMQPHLLVVISSGLPISPSEVGLPTDARWAVLQKPYLPGQLWALLESEFTEKSRAASA